MTQGPSSHVAVADAPPPIANELGAATTGLAEDEATTEMLSVLAEDIVSFSGFAVAVFSVRDCPDNLKVVAVAGDERVRDSLMHACMPLPEVDSLLDLAEPWGRLRFVADATAHVESIDNSWTWVEEESLAATTGTSYTNALWLSNKWQKENALLAPLWSGDESLLGLLSVDLPTSGLRPTAAQRATLAMYARQAERAIAAGAQRARTAHELRLAQAAHLVVREAATQLHLADLLPTARSTLLLNFGVEQVWLKTAPVEVGAGGHQTTLTAPPLGHADALDQDLLPTLSIMAAACWHQQNAHVIDTDSVQPEDIDNVSWSCLMQFLSRHHIASALLVPIGSGKSRLGSMLLGRSAGARVWTEPEKAAALDIGHDIGRAIAHTLWLEAQERAVDELRLHTEHKTQLLMAMSHELQTPIAAIRNHVELLTPDSSTDPYDRRALSAIDRNADRLTKLVNNMLWLARIDDPLRPPGESLVDLAGCLQAVLEDATQSDLIELNPTTAHPSGPGSRTLVSKIPTTPVLVRGSESELILLCCNLVANALKFTDDGGHVWVDLVLLSDEACLYVVDDGIGIAADEASLVFDEFFRSTSEAARRRPGTGLGLSIAQKIANRHDGSLTLGPISAETYSIFAQRHLSSIFGIQRSSRADSFLPTKTAVTVFCAKFPLAVP